ncbi:hypothetical protein TYRP_009744 [Tyrophagus putrescentiae]|nr:hypothetical protein TYRP_009744 [Tyrophagus putrescentiae]
MAELNPPDKDDERRQRSDHFEEDIDDLMTLPMPFFTNRDTLAFGQAETIDPFLQKCDYQLQWGTALSATAAAGQSEPENSSGLPGKTNGGSPSNPPKQNSAQTEDVARIEQSQIVGEQEEKMTYNELECKYHLALRQIKKQGNEIEALSKKKLELEKKLAEPNDSFGKAPVPNQAPCNFSKVGKMVVPIEEESIMDTSFEKHLRSQSKVVLAESGVNGQVKIDVNHLENYRND